MPWQAENELIQERYRKWKEWVQRRGEDPFQITRFERTHRAAEIHQRFEELQGRTVRVAGRILRRAQVGKLSFAHIRDASGRVQLVFEHSVLGEEEYRLVRLLDLGDIVGAEGEVFQTRTGERSVRVRRFWLLAKALRPLPEKWHGLRDVEIRYRQRYVDLIMNEEVHTLFQRRSLIIRSIRRFLDEEGFLEVETPMLHLLPGGALARPFTTHHNALGLDLYLRIAPELHLKRLIVGGYEKVYEINRNFRNEGVSTRHNPEFTMLEAYQAYADYEDIMRLSERLLAYVCQQVHGTLRVPYQGHEIDWTPPWPRVRLYDALREHTGIDFEAIRDDEPKWREAAQRLGLPLAPYEGFPHLIDAALKKLVIPRLIQPTFLVEYPVELSPLAKRKADQPHLTERFQLVVGGLELENAFSELNHPIDQQERFEAQQAQRARGDEEAHPMDWDFLRALEYGMPPTGGLGIGIDRLTMLLCNVNSIREVILFPLLRPEEEHAFP